MLEFIANGTKKAYSLSSLSGVALSWLLRLHESYRIDWSAFVSAFEENFFSLKSFVLKTSSSSSRNKKETENVRHCALKVQAVVL